MKLLVVDDDVHIRRIVALYLRDHDVAEAASAEEALARVGAETFDVVIVDVILPHFGGLRLCRKIKETATPPRVIVMSGDEQLRDFRGGEIPHKHSEVYIRKIETGL